MNSLHKYLIHHINLIIQNMMQKNPEKTDKNHIINRQIQIQLQLQIPTKKRMQTKSLIETYSLSPNNKSKLKGDQNSQQLVKYKQFIDRICAYPRYQYIMTIFISLFWLLISFNAMIGAFVFMNPLFVCNGDQPKTEKQACQIIDKCKITNDFTAAYTNHLYCQKQNIRSTIQSIFALGLTIGMVFMPLLSDLIGRRKVMILLFAIGSLSYAGMYYSILYDVEIGMILSSNFNGVFGAGITVMSFILTCDFCPQKMRERFILIYCAFWGIGQMFFYFFYFFMPQWQRFLAYALFIPTTIMFILLLIFKIQSPVYAIFFKKDKNLTLQIIDKLVKYNRIDDEQKLELINQGDQLIKIIKQKQIIQKRNKVQLLQILHKILCQKANAVSCICLTIALISFNFFYYGMQGSMQRTGYNFGTSMLLLGFNQFLAYLSASYITKYIRRKLGAILSVFFTCGIGLLFLLQIVKNEQIVQTIIAVVLRVGSVYAYSFILLLETQSFDTQVRSTALALIAGIAQISRIAVPYVINFFNDLGIHIIIFSSILFLVFGAIPILALKQTYSKKQKLKSQYNPDQSDQKDESERKGQYSQYEDERN